LRTFGSIRSSIDRDPHRDDAEDHPGRVALTEAVAAEAAETGDAVGQVDFVALLESFPMGRGKHGGLDSGEVVDVEALLLAGRDTASPGRASSDRCRP
jgi:hypothetical protein